MIKQNKNSMAKWYARWHKLIGCGRKKLIVQGWSMVFLHPYMWIDCIWFTRVWKHTINRPCTINFFHQNQLKPSVSDDYCLTMKILSWSIGVRFNCFVKLDIHSLDLLHCGFFTPLVNYPMGGNFILVNQNGNIK